MRPRRIAAAAVVLAAVSAASVGLALRAGRSPDKLAEVIGIPAPTQAQAQAQAQSVSPSTSADPAPELEGLTAWHNSSPLTLKSLRGKVILLDFWTYSCINCRRTFPLLRALQERYAADGLVVIGVHSPEFDFEKSHASVVRAVHDLHVTWPVAEDPDKTTWAAYGNEYWPADYIVDRAGRLRAHHVGEGGAGVIEDAVRRLLAEGGPAPEPALVGSPSASERPPSEAQQVTPERYLGAARGLGTIASPGPVNVDEHARRDDPPAAAGQVSLTGQFLGADEWVQGAIGARLQLSYRARDVYVTARPAGPRAVLEILLDGKPVPAGRRGRDVVALADGTTVARLGPDDLRHLVTGPVVAPGRLTLIVRGAPVRFYTLTFGG